jgi:hypothetical protein
VVTGIGGYLLPTPEGDPHEMQKPFCEPARTPFDLFSFVLQCRICASTYDEGRINTKEPGFLMNRKINRDSE